MYNEQASVLMFNCYSKYNNKLLNIDISIMNLHVHIVISISIKEKLRVKPKVAVLIGPKQTKQTSCFRRQDLYLMQELNRECFDLNCSIQQAIEMIYYHLSSQHGCI